MEKHIIKIKNLGLKRWDEISLNMYKFTCSRNENTLDEIWFVEHYPVYTIGQSTFIQKKMRTFKNIPLFYSHRGGKITYHGPGQQLMYLLIDLNRLNINVKNLLNIIENVLICTLKMFNIQGVSKKNMPGIYIHNKKICSIGLRIKNGCSLHGIALNVNMNMYPFSLINPCGFKNIQMTQIKNFQLNVSLISVRNMLIKYFLKYLNIYISQKNYT
ncbi:octanoyltransferase [Buchnera aphidicola (Nipponaphis monzeni)]|uniref:Octanoyltransferase n=1 Tax=Buchnera aphidicola (Nipponaphis monzeni) TaxID=2495405 RepID=A0A455TA66_9GAMM|nr:lipoyl(octanoyl) transferase LipB [Buchnera aphidicola]BBI01223.1 octanoyltransferase [Buchnera aphidicola (Nipponaphis monzeni)]